MKNLILFAFSLFFILGTSSFTIINNEIVKFQIIKIDTEKLCKTWYIISGVTSAEEKEIEHLSKKRVNVKMIFNKNLTLEIIEAVDSEEIQKGTWKEVNGKLFINIENNKTSLTIETLTDKKLIISYKESGTTTSMTLSSSPKKDIFKY